MPRTTLDLDPSVIRELRTRGAREGKSMGRVASEPLARSLAERRDEPATPPQWISRSLGTPLVDIYTRDRDFRRFDGIRAVEPFA